MIVAFRAAVMLGGSSVVAIVSSLVLAKALAVVIGPAGVGTFGLLQVIVEFAVLVGGAGVSISVVDAITSARETSDRTQYVAARRGAVLLAWSLGFVVAAILFLSSDAIAQVIFGTKSVGDFIAFSALAVPLTIAGGVNVATLSSDGRVGAIALVRSAAVVVLATTTIVAVILLGLGGAPIGIVAAACTLWIGSSTALRLRGTIKAGHDLERLGRAVVSLLRFGLPYLASALVGTGVQLAIPMIVALSAGTEGAGIYRAATQISAGYVALVAAAMLQDYYPRMSAQRTDAEALTRLIDQQLRLVMCLTIPPILLGITFADVIVPVLYSSAFGPTAVILGWQLIGTILKIPSWTLAFALLARGRAVTYFSVELLAGVALLGTSVLGMAALGYSGLGVAVLATYVIYYAAVWLAVRRDLPLILTNAQRVLIGTVATVSVIETLPVIGLGQLRMPLALGLTGLSLLIVAAIGRRAVVTFVRERAMRRSEANAVGPR